jgi:hypothetical protein
MRTLWTATAVVRAPVERVAAQLTAPDGDGLWLTRGRHEAVTVEVGDRSVVLQGGWWYRGEWEVAPRTDGSSLLTHRVIDVARWGRWMVPLVLLQYRRSGIAGPAATTRAVTELAERRRRRWHPEPHTRTALPAGKGRSSSAGQWVSAATRLRASLAAPSAW